MGEKPTIVEQYWTGVTHRLQVEADVFNRLIVHNAEMGRENELSLAKILERLLPANLGVGTGIVFDSSGNRSQQCDVIIYDVSQQPRILAQTNQLLFPVETVLLVVEVKTTVDKKAIADAGAKKVSLSGLSSSRGGKAVDFAFFGYQCGGAAVSSAREFLRLDKSHQPDLVCVINPGIVGCLGGSPDPWIGFTPVHERQLGGARVSKTWVRPPDGAETHVLEGATSFPIARTEPYTGTRLVCEPGRALLVFTHELLKILGSRSDLVAADWVRDYVPDMAREVEPIELPVTRP